MSDIVERLRADARFIRGEPDCVGPRVTLLCESAADEITALRAENERLRAALRDIATGQVTYLPFIQTVARAALEEKP